MRLLLCLSRRSSPTRVSIHIKPCFDRSISVLFLSVNRSIHRPHFMGSSTTFTSLAPALTFPLAHANASTLSATASPPVVSTTLPSEKSTQWPAPESIGYTGVSQDSRPICHNLKTVFQASVRSLSSPVMTLPLAHNASGCLAAWLVRLLEFLVDDRYCPLRHHGCSVEKPVLSGSLSVFFISTSLTGAIPACRRILRSLLSTPFPVFPLSSV